jgi:tRNA 2-thiouridine synthesizing protein A
MCGKTDEGAEGESAEIVVDARGHRCPTPTLRLQKALAAATPGARLRLLADDPLARIDAPHYAAAVGLEVLGVQSEGTILIIRFRVPESGLRRAVGGNDAPPPGDVLSP